VRSMLFSVVKCLPSRPLVHVYVHQGPSNVQKVLFAGSEEELHVGWSGWNTSFEMCKHGRVHPMSIPAKY
jgi:hypothetical protein